MSVRNAYDEVMSDAHDRTAVAPGRVLDPVCGMTIDPERAAGRTDYNGQTYYFCSKRCLERFEADPEAFLAPAGTATPAAGTVATPFNAEDTEDTENVFGVWQPG